MKVPKNSNTIHMRSNPKHPHVNKRSASLSTRCYIVSVKLFLTLVRDAYLWGLFASCLGLGS